MSGRIFLLNDQNQTELIAMEEALYDSEKLLQEMLAKHTDLLAGEQIDSKNPRRWLLITREMAVPDEKDGAARWSLDHLFLDQDGVPTLIEVKRSTDSRIRREVVGQMLDYVAKGGRHRSDRPVRKVQVPVLPNGNEGMDQFSIRLAQ